MDQACVVYVNGQRAARHTGGYLPFEADITALVRDGENELTLAVKDLSDTSYHARGKQRLERGGMFYTAQSGIWQTVWMEEVPETYIANIEAEADLEKSGVRIRVLAAENPGSRVCANGQVVHTGTPSDKDGEESSQTGHPITIQIQHPELYTDNASPKSKNQPNNHQMCSVSGITGDWIEIPVPDIRLWTCETPYLYFLTVTMGEDRAESYFAMRKFSIKEDEDEIPRICLNGKAQFQNGVLDQGYWHCDRLGLMVWQDMVNRGEAYRYWFVTYLATVMSWRGITIKDNHPWLLARRDKAGRDYPDRRESFQTESAT